MRLTIRYALPLFFAAVLLSGCAATWYAAPPPDYDSYQPGYVYTYADGCWADDRWFAPCPWTPGPYFGYYYYNDGFWWFHSEVYWGYVPGRPPPPSWRYHDPGRHPRYPAPPPRRGGPPHGGGYGHGGPDHHSHHHH